MHSKLTIFDMTIPSYGAMVLLGAFVVTVLGIVISWWKKLQVFQFLKLELWSGLAAIIGSKLWYLMTNTYKNYEQDFTLNSFLDSGYSSYGGIVFGMSTAYIVAKILRLDFEIYAKNLIFLVPLFHAFWKFGCYMGGCCYGIKYSGVGTITFPEGVKAPAGIPLFPVQLLEVMILVMLSIMFFIRGITKLNRPVVKYVGWYTSLRFITDFFRQHSNNELLSVAQKISIVCCLSIILWHVFEKRKIKIWRKHI